MALKRYNSGTASWELVSAKGQEITVSPTEPTTPDVGDIWIDSDETTTFPSSNSFIDNEVPTGAVNGVNADYTTSQGYIAGSLQVFINGLKQASVHVTETTPVAGLFALDVAPATGDVIDCSYQVAADPYSGNADTLDGYHLSAILEAQYPVGALFFSDSSTMPTLIANIGTWSRIEGMFIVGASDSDGDFDNGDTGGSKTHQHEQTVGGDPAQMYVDESNPHGSRVYNASGNRGQLNLDSTVPGNIRVGNTSSVSGLPPYKAKYMWERVS